jgi:hypothetical protein
VLATLRRPATVIAALLAALVAAALALVPSAASAAPDHHSLRFKPISVPAIGTPLQAKVVRNGYNQDGQNWSGFAATGSGFSSVTSSWTEPNVTCNSTNDLFAPWVGIDGYGTPTVEQTGVATDCSSGSPVYHGWYEMYPASPVYYSNPVAPGDSMTATVTRSGTSYGLKLTDNTQGWTKTTNQTLVASNASVEVIMESPTGAYPNFGSVNFSGSTVDGSTLGTTNPVALDASNSGGFEDHTSALSGGTDFSISYLRE